MELQLKNIEMIKEANVKLDGLTVIAGENDTGKSTVGKELFKQIRKYIIEKEVDNSFILDIKEEVHLPIFIDTPDLLAKFNYIKNTSVLLQQNKLNFALPIEVTDLILRISQPKEQTRHNLEFKIIKNIISGEIYYDKSKDDIFYKTVKNKKTITFPMSKTSSGIKMFGYFQMLILNNSIRNGTVLILDEPEVHLHPKWQLEMAKIIVEFVKKGVKVLVTSHSPYMIEALERYAEKAEVPVDFYLAEDGYIDKVEDNNSKTLAKIFHKLSAPYETFNQMDSEILKGG